MKWTIFTTVCFAYCFYGAYASNQAEDADFFDIDLFLQRDELRHKRAPDYGGGLGGPLAASGWTPPPKNGQKPPAQPQPPPKSAEKPKPDQTPAPTQKPTQKPTTGSKPKSSPTTPSQQKSSPTTASQQKSSAQTQGPTAPTKTPSKQEKSGDNSGGGGGTNGKSGEEIANDIYNHPTECKDPADGGVWAPLPKGQTCGKDGNCPYPQKWCSAKQDGAGSSSTPTMSCQDLPPDCQKVLGGSGSGGSETTSTAATTTQGQTSTSSTPTTTKPTTAAAAKLTPPTTAAPTTQSNSNCQDNHPYCCFWADDKSGRPSECDRNSRWMKSQCPKSCGTCGCTSGNCPTKVNTQGCQWLNGGAGAGGSRMTRIFLGGSPGVNPSGFGGNGFNGFRGAGNGFNGFGGNGFGGNGNGRTTIVLG